MPVYQIDYDLKEPGQDYDKVHDTIKSMGDFIHPLESTWMVDTDKSASEIRDELKSVTDNNDHIIVVKFRPPYATFLNSSENEWLDDHL